MVTKRLTGGKEGETSRKERETSSDYGLSKKVTSGEGGSFKTVVMVACLREGEWLFYYEGK